MMTKKRKYRIFIFTDDLERAFELMKDVQPTQSTEYILKGVVNAVYGQEHHSVGEDLDNVRNNLI